MFNGIMRKFGFISEKELIKLREEIPVGSFYYCCGNANAVGYILSRFGIDIASVIKDRKKKAVGEQE